MSAHNLKDSFSPAPPSQKTVDSFVLAAGEGNIDSVAEFVGKHKGSLNLESNFGSTALTHAVWNGQEKIVRFLLQSGAAVDAKGDSGSTPLMLASRVEISQLLLEKGASLHETNKKGKTAGVIAKEYGWTETAALLEKWPKEQRQRSLSAERLEKLKNQRPKQSPFRKNKP